MTSDGSFHITLLVMQLLNDDEINMWVMSFLNIGFQIITLIWVNVAEPKKRHLSSKEVSFIMIYSSSRCTELTM